MNTRDTITTAGTVGAFVALGSGGLAWLWTANWRWAATGAILFLVLAITAGVASRTK